MQQHTVPLAQCSRAVLLHTSACKHLGRCHILEAAKSRAIGPSQAMVCTSHSTSKQLVVGAKHPSSVYASHRQSDAAVTLCRAYAAESTVAMRSTLECTPVPPEFQNRTYLQELRAQDFALVRDGAVHFTPGLNAISGESGAGKSVLLGALMQLLGAPADADCVRHGADVAVVEGRWWLDLNMAQQVTSEMRNLTLPSKAMPAGGGDSSGGGYLHIKRELAKSDDGTVRSRVLINGCSSSLRVLRVLGSLLVDVNAQHASVALREGRQQLQLLDTIAGSGHLVQQLSNRISRLSELEGLLSQADALSDDNERQALEEDVEAIDEARIQPDEEVILRRRLAALQARKTNLEAAALAQASLQGDYSEGQSMLDVARMLLVQVRSVLSAEQEQHRLLLAEKQKDKATAEDSSGEAGDPAAAAAAAAAAAEDAESELEVETAAVAVRTLETAVEELEDIVVCVQGASSQLQQYADAMGYSATDAATISKRLDQLTKLCRRFGVRTTSELLELADKWSEQLDAYYENLDKQGVWRAEATSLQQQITDLALQLSSLRSAAAVALSAAVERCFHQLAMSRSRFLVDLRWQRSNRVQPCSRAVLVPAAAEPKAAHHQDIVSSSLEGVSSTSSNSSSSNGSVTRNAEDGRDITTTTSGSSGSSSSSVLYDLSPTGFDHVEFLLSAGPAEPLRALSTVASGGEAARVMLALKAAPAAAAAAAAAANRSWQSAAAGVRLTSHQQGEEDSQPADQAPGQAVLQHVIDHGLQQELTHQQQQQLAAAAGVLALVEQEQQQQQQQGREDGAANSSVFSIGPPVVVMDETDAGVGARLGHTVGRLLRDMTVGSCPAAQQLIVVSHTPQVAAHATHHIKVSKATSDADGRVITTFNALESADERKAELADMMGRPGDTQALGFADEMLAAAHGHDRN